MKGTGYRHFYYFSTPLRRWLAFKSRVWPAMPRLVEHTIVTALDQLIALSGVRDRCYRRQKKKAVLAGDYRGQNREP
jgi:hypothetical protein